MNGLRFFDCSPLCSLRSVHLHQLPPDRRLGPCRRLLGSLCRSIISPLVTHPRHNIAKVTGIPIAKVTRRGFPRRAHGVGGPPSGLQALRRTRRLPPARLMPGWLSSARRDEGVSECMSAWLGLGLGFGFGFGLGLGLG